MPWIGSTHAFDWIARATGNSIHLACLLMHRPQMEYAQKENKKRCRKKITRLSASKNKRSIRLFPHTLFQCLSKYSLHYYSLWFTACVLVRKLFPQRRRSKWGARIEWAHEIYMFIFIECWMGEKKRRRAHLTPQYIVARAQRDIDVGSNDAACLPKDRARELNDFIICLHKFSLRSNWEN